MQTLYLDDLPDDRLTDALALLAYLRRRPMRWFVAGAPSARAAEDLARCGYLRLTPRRDGPVLLLDAEVIQ